MRIAPLDARDDGAFAAWHATYLAAERHGREHATPWAAEEVRAGFLGERTGERFLPVAGHVEERLVCCGTVRLPQRDNLETAHVELWTHPAHRRRGHGSTLLEHLVGLARDDGRTRIGTRAAVPYEGAPDGTGQAAADFLTRRGFRFVLADVVRVLDLPPDLDRVRELAEQAASRHTGCTLRRFRGAVPADLVDGFGSLVGSLLVEAPSGEAEREPEVFDEARIRADEAVFEASGRTKYTTVALTGEGLPIAYSEVVVPRHDPGKVFQWGTLVHPDHRGHRLGMAVKAATLRWVCEVEPDRTLLVTTNAEENRPMVAINDALGFRPVERAAEFERDLRVASARPVPVTADAGTPRARRPARTPSPR